MKPRCVAVIGILVGVCCAALGEVHVWTDTEGRAAEAEFAGLEGDTLILQKGSKTLRVPLSNFSEEDQAYAHGQAEMAKAERERMEQERAEKMQSLLGLRYNVAINERRWADWEDYYTKSICRYTMKNFFEYERSIVNVWSKGVFVSAEEAVRPSGYAPTMTTYCPDDYDGTQPYGVYLHISPGGGAINPDDGYQKMMKKYRLIYASMNGTSNDDADMRRLAITLDALAQLRKDFNVDENRVYVGGTSGGGAEATMAAFLYPDDFCGSLNSVRNFFVRSEGGLPFAKSSDITKSARKKIPFAFISGPGDPNYPYMPETEKSFLGHRFCAKFFDIPGMNHETASAETFDRVMEWIEDNNPRLQH